MDQAISNQESDRLRILRLVSEGKVNAGEGKDLLDALNPFQKGKTTSRSAQPGTNETNVPRWFRIRVTNLTTGRSKVTVNIPFSLAEWGLRIGARFSPEVADIDLGELAQLLSQRDVEGKIVDVVDEEDGDHIEIFIE